MKDYDERFKDWSEAVFEQEGATIQTKLPKLEVARNERNLPLALESILSFGKHKGKQIEDLIEDFPGYIKWMVENEVRDFDEEVMELLAKKGII